MLYKAIVQSVHGVSWDGSSFSEKPEWLPEVVGAVTFAMTHKRVITLNPPFAWLGNGGSSTRINPGDEIVLENGNIRVMPSSMFQELFEPVLQLAPGGESMRASA